MIAVAGALLGACGVVGRFVHGQEKQVADTGGVRTITLPVMQPDLPDAPGRDAVTAACVICHSTRYITMQPRFSKTVWTAEVDKMRKTFGAPITDQQAAVIVDYLVAIRGTPAAGAK
jgi:hypothetical protein